MKKLRFIISIMLVMALVLSFASCGYEYFDLNLRASYENNLAGTELNVYNWGEYISVGGDGDLDVNKEFERITGIKVNYTTFDSNETMYSQLKNGGVSYDIIVPSDYMIERLKNENMLKKFDTSKLSNFDLIDDRYKGLFFDENNEYSVAYNVGMVGLIYNGAVIKEDIHSWSALWDEKYKGQSLMFDNPRDAFAIAQFRLGQSLNSTNKADWDKAKELLIQQKQYLQSYVMDEVFSKMETGEAAIAPYYAGDYFIMKEINPDLKFVYPDEGTNIFVDSVCIPTCCKNYEAALLYINFLLEPDIALANAEYIGYASPNTSVTQNEEYSLYGEEILYPSDTEYMDTKTQYFHDIDSDIKTYYENLWLDIKRD
ncbi:MAG: spermidine/putrescine ABC transporter substrate-binding protein [Clostridiales bacterium]|nr:spermidine/putrescine ABC transporter substrate-binding protein [Candidatus Equinaster intestinalis]